MSARIVYRESLKPFAQKLRREMTRQECRLWYDYLKSYPQTFRRQKQFGAYIVDFYCSSVRLVVEIDGSQHYEPDEKAQDEKRERYLNGLGLAVIRFSNYDIDRHFDGVCETIDRTVKERCLASP